jgi:hypothetical protein
MCFRVFVFVFVLFFFCDGYACYVLLVILCFGSQLRKVCRPHRDLLDVKKLGGVEMCVCVWTCLRPDPPRGHHRDPLGLQLGKGEHVDAKKLVGARKT